MNRILSKLTVGRSSFFTQHRAHTGALCGTKNRFWEGRSGDGNGAGWLSIVSDYLSERSKLDPAPTR